MRKKFASLGVFSLIVFAVGYILMLNARYLYNDNNDYITILQYDDNILVSFIVSGIFIVLLLISIILLKRLKPDWLKTKFIFFMTLLPAYPAFSGLLRLLYEVLIKGDYYYHRLGSRFSIHHLELYPNAMTMREFEVIGEGLKYGAGLYLALFLLVLIIGNTLAMYYAYYITYIKETY